jgi:hypothetical protein
MSAMPFIPTRPVFVRPVFVHLTLFNFNDEASRWFGAATSSRETPPGLLYTGRQLMPLRNSASHTMYLMSPPPSRSFHFPVFVWLGIAPKRSTFASTFCSPPSSPEHSSLHLSQTAHPSSSGVARRQLYPPGPRHYGPNHLSRCLVAALSFFGATA